MPLTTGVINQFAAPPLLQLSHSTASPVALANPYSGSGVLACSAGGVYAYGVAWSVSSSPAGAGRSTRTVVVYEQPFLSLATNYTLADASFFKGDHVLTGDDEGILMFSLASPTSLEYNILAGWTVHFDWLIHT